MKQIQLIPFLVLMVCGLFAQSNKDEKHVFILSGQSNMKRLDPEISFIPVLEKHFGNNNIVVVKYALGGQPIRRWYREWKAPKGFEEYTKGADLYDSLMLRVYPRIENIAMKSVTFVWMQGGRDAKMGWSAVYKRSLIGLHKQLAKDLGVKRSRLNFVIGRMSDTEVPSNEQIHWDTIKKVQMEVADSKPNFVWVNTDDLNDGFDAEGNLLKNDLHYSVEGYKVLGERFAESAIRLIER